jgi:hypothetical protein
MNDETKEQEKMIDIFSNGDSFGWSFKYPCCRSEVMGLPMVTNKGEKLTQIYCPYCRMYLFLDDYKKGGQDE